MGLIPRSGQSISNWLEIKRCSTFPTRPWPPPPRSKQAANAKKSVSLSQRLICWAHCDALNQSLDGTAGRLLKSDFLWIFRRQNANPAIGLWLSPQIKAEDHKYWEIYDYAAFVDNAVLSTYSELCKEVRSLWTTPYHKERHARIHKHAQRLSFFFPTGWTEHHLQGCDGMHTSTRLWCKTRTVWNANHGEKGERGEERSFFTVESIYIMLLFVSLNRVLLWRGTPMRAVMGNISPALKRAAVATRTEWLPLLLLHQLSSSCE